VWVVLSSTSDEQRYRVLVEYARQEYDFRGVPVMSRVVLGGGFRAEDFEVDGSLRDVRLLEVDLVVWERLVGAAQPRSTASPARGSPASGARRL
jgi:hypothetical protein